jgi:hypothetical protein
VGRIVHYVSHGTPILPDGSQTYTSQCRAALVTQVWVTDNDQAEPTTTVGLAVLNPTGMFFHETVELDEGGSGGYTGGTWHWPERV